MFERILLLLIPSPFTVTYACWGGGTPTPDGPSMLNPLDEALWNGWEAPPGAEKAWEDWLQKFRDEMGSKGRLLTDEEKAAGVLPAGHNVEDWPPEWKDLGQGFGGMAPPPWAYVPKNEGKSPSCYMRPVKGNCDKWLWRYGYNPFTDECLAFVYSGCGGNYNNFNTKEACVAECINPVMGCDPESEIPIPVRGK